MSSEITITNTTEENTEQPIEFTINVNIIEPFYVTISPSLDFTIKI